MMASFLLVVCILYKQNDLSNISTISTIQIDFGNEETKENANNY